jgi:hypothetical protein
MLCVIFGTVFLDLVRAFADTDYMHFSCLRTHSRQTAYIMYMSQPGAAFAITGGGWPNVVVGATR